MRGTLRRPFRARCIPTRVVEGGVSATLAGAVPAGGAASGGASAGGVAVHSAVPKDSVCHAALTAGGGNVAPDAPVVFTVPTEDSADRVFIETSTDDFPVDVAVLGAHSCAVGDDSSYDMGDYNSGSTLKPAAARRAAMHKQIGCGSLPFGFGYGGLAMASVYMLVCFASAGVMAVDTPSSSPPPTFNYISNAAPAASELVVAASVLPVSAPPLLPPRRIYRTLPPPCTHWERCGPDSIDFKDNLSSGPSVGDYPTYINDSYYGH
ncbi:hypothetical protein CYMTET_25072 [Cymbomonas tetramitiformis]|uniref:Uncharacterized protein n=1 Tax=Cymbomonas tetramitiformis TaxID=36881 RepID=A0AAE0FUX3_9CHLO|nr:hypothetical protein CYMTET_25072 [Cymbomonas tetramitiformis]